MKKKFKFPPIIRAASIVLLMLFSSLHTKAQVSNAPVLSWDQAVGCIDYDDEIKEREKEKIVNLLEDIEEGRCIRFCEGSYVNYTLQAANVTLVQWEVTGGNLMSSSNTGAAIQWGSSGNGSITLTITYSDNTVQVRTVCVEKIISPTAMFQIAGPDPKQKEFCTDTPITFDNLSTHNNGTAIVNYLWDFGDGTFSNTFEPTHIYTQEGPYEVILTVTNSCNCSSTYSRKIYVKKAKPVEITCVNVECEGNVATYTANDDCKGKWKVTGGTIVSNNGSSIIVKWDQIDIAEGMGYVSYMSDCSCPFWTTVKIPVITGKAKIKGPNAICEGKQGRFTLPQWPTTDFRWTINGNPNHPMLVLTDQRNEIVVDGATPGTYTLAVEYRNTLLGCGGKATYKFDVVEKTVILTDDELTICQNTSKTFNTASGNSVNWSVTLNNTVVYSAVGTSITYAFGQPGSYVVTANNNGCISDPVVVDVIATPVITGTITGLDKVCLNAPYTYSITENEPGAIYIWSVTGGNVIGNNSGTEVDIAFTSATATVSVIKQYVKNGKICQSAPVTYTVSELQINPSVINNSGLAEFCPSSTATFTANLNGIDVDHIEWKILSSTGQTNFGNIISGVNSSTVTVSFNEITSSAIGNLYLIVKKCGKTIEVPYQIKLVELPALTLATIGDICPGDPTITLQLSATNLPPGSHDVKVSFNGATPVGPYTFTSGIPFTIPNGFSNNTSGNVSQTITLILDNVCNYSGTSISQNVIVFPLTKVDITPGYHYVVCPTNYQPITLSASVSTGITLSTEFVWYKGTTPIPGGTLSDYTITGPNPGGTYHVRVKDINECWVSSESIVVLENCGSSPGCTITPDPNLQVWAWWDSCNKIKASTTYVGNPTVKWYGSPKISLSGGQGTDNAEFTTDVAGNHTVTVELNYNGCIVTKSVSVAKNYQAKIDAAVTCNANGTYNVTLHNNSTTYNIATSSINFNYYNSSNVLIGSGQSVTLTNVPAGSHTYTLTLTSAGKPSCSEEITVNLDPAPTTAFSVSPTVYCAEEPITLTVPGTYNSAYRYEWHFTGTHYVASGPVTQVNIQDAGSYQIWLKIITPLGCSFETPVAMRPSITVNKAEFDGDILPNPLEFCEGSTQLLQFISNNPSNVPANAIWMQGNVQVGTGLTYAPTQSGSYWPVLIGANGCKDYSMSGEPAIVKIRKSPFASIDGNTSVCFGENTMLTGIVTDPTVQHSWSGPNLPAGYSNWVTGNTNVVLHLNGLNPGTYTYTFSARAANDTTCVSSFTTTVVVHPQVAAPGISYSVTGCQPYTLQLTASGPSIGTYNWSNGEVGQTIEVTHGGAYSVTYTAPTGCTATSVIQTPHNPERSLWIVPTGCYTLCLNQGEHLLGPLGIYDGYQWTINQGVTQSGSYTNIPIQYITMGGIYQLSVTQQICTFKSNTLHITPKIKDCPVSPCGLKAGFKKEIGYENGVYYLYGSVTNFNAYPITVNFSSFNNYGVYVPGTVTIPANSTYSLSPLEFHPNNTFYPGATDYIMIQMQGCMDLVEVRFPQQMNSMAAPEDNIVPASLALSPNPASETTLASFDIGSEYRNAQYVVLYDVLGVQRSKQAVSGTKGDIQLYIGHLASGTYIVSLEVDGKRIAQQKLIKK